MKNPNMYEEPEETRITLNLSDEQQYVVDQAHEAVTYALQKLADNSSTCFGARMIEETTIVLANILLKANIPVHYPGIVCDYNGNDLYVEEWLGTVKNGKPLS